MKKIEHINIDKESTNNFFVYFNKSFLQSILKARLYIDGIAIDKIAEGKYQEYTLSDGKHEITCKILGAKSNTLTINIEQNKQVGIIIQPKLLKLEIFTAALQKTKSIKKVYIMGNKRSKNYLGGMVSKTYLELSNEVSDNALNTYNFIILYDDNTASIEKVTKESARFEQLIKFFPVENEPTEIEEFINIEDVLD